MLLTASPTKPKAQVTEVAQKRTKISVFLYWDPNRILRFLLLLLRLFPAFCGQSPWSRTSHLTQQHADCCIHMSSAPTSPSPPPPPHTHGVILATNSNYSPKQSSTINLPNVNVIKYFNYGLVVYTTLCSEMSMIASHYFRCRNPKARNFLNPKQMKHQLTSLNSVTLVHCS
jgi:hypothetical protein